MKQYKLLFPEKFSDYKLIDSGNGQKLEQFGRYTIIRPEPHAIWKPQLSNYEWEGMAHARYEVEDAQKGKWVKLKEMNNPWKIKYRGSNFTLFFELRFTQFRHLGIFPEQSSHWEFIWEQTNRLKKPKVLNLFAYTGGASMAAKAAGADVIHCEAMRQVVAWAKHNMQVTKLDDIRWLIEDALKFVKREEKRGHQYNGIIMDPPSFGIGPNGERWKLHDKLPNLIKSACSLLVPEESFMVVNTYSHHQSPLVLKGLVENHLGRLRHFELGELAIRSGQAQVLPAGSYLRFVY